MSHLDYLAIGHITHDVTPEGYTIGGTVAYSSLAAQALGCRVAVLTSAGADCDVQAALPEVEIVCIPSRHTTTFENRYAGEQRVQHLYQTAASLQPEHVPAEWRRTPIVHLAPVAGEVAVETVQQFSNSLVGLTLQGWLRDCDETGRVIPRAWLQAQEVLPLAAAVILSEEDLPDEGSLEEFRHWSRLLVLTHGAAGCTVYLGEESRRIPAPRVYPNNLTGAGDIFAAAFFIRLYQTKGNPWEAAEFANYVAAQSVQQPDLQSKVKALTQLSV